MVERLTRDTLDDDLSDENIGFNEDGILFLYNSYELEFLGQEIFEFIIPYEAIAQYLNYELE